MIFLIDPKSGPTLGDLADMEARDWLEVLGGLIFCGGVGWLIASFVL